MGRWRFTSSCGRATRHCWSAHLPWSCKIHICCGRRSCWSALTSCCGMWISEVILLRESLLLELPSISSGPRRHGSGWWLLSIMCGIFRLYYGWRRHLWPNVGWTLKFICCAVLCRLRWRWLGRPARLNKSLWSIRKFITKRVKMTNQPHEQFISTWISAGSCGRMSSLGFSLNVMRFFLRKWFRSFCRCSGMLGISLGLLF